MIPDEYNEPQARRDGSDGSGNHPACNQAADIAVGRQWFWAILLLSLVIILIIASVGFALTAAGTAERLYR